MQKFRDDIGMSCGLGECTKSTFKREKLTGTIQVELDRKTAIKDLEQEEVCKYIDFEESNGIQLATIKEKRQCYWRV